MHRSAAQRPGCSDATFRTWPAYGLERSPKVRRNGPEVSIGAAWRLVMFTSLTIAVQNVVLAVRLVRCDFGRLKPFGVRSVRHQVAVVVRSSV